MELSKNSSKVALNPLPVPIKKFSNDPSPTWPTNREGFLVYHHGRLDDFTKSVTINDVSSSYMLTRMGSFGRTPEPPKPLMLDLVEAYFLSYALGCLIVVENDRKYNLDELWIRFCELQNDFAAVYAVYHLYRSKGWVVKRGSHLGTTFTLYKEGPDYNHALYAVDVNMISENSDTSNNWQSLLAKHRVVQSVSKNLLIANVMFDKELDLTSPKCIKEFQITTNIVSRWRSQTEVFVK